MKRLSVHVTVPHVLRHVDICARRIRLVGRHHQVVLIFRDAEHVDELLDLFAKAWIRWDESDDIHDLAPFDLQQTLPF